MAFAKIESVNSASIGRRIPLKFCYSDGVFLLLRISENKEFKDGKWLDTINGYTYECVDTMNFDKIRVKIDGQTKPLMTDEELQTRRESGEKVWIEFVDATLMPYINSQRVLTDSIKATDVLLVE